MSHRDFTINQQIARHLEEDSKTTEGTENDMLLYNPYSDEKMVDWIHKKKKNKNNTKSWVLSCPGCFTQVCYDCQQHEIYKSQYRAVFVQNCNIDQNKIIQQKNMKIYNSMMGKEDKDIELEKKRICAELYFSVSCANCGCEIGVFDALEKVYHFFQVIPGSG